MKVVVTGGAGFIGANLVRRLLKEKRDLRVVDNVSRGHSENLKGLDVEIVSADLRRLEEAQKALRDTDIVYHLAARVGSVKYLHESKAAELNTLQDNLLVDTNVFKVASVNGVRKVIYTSSVSVYPINKQVTTGVKFSEDDSNQVNPEGGYGWAKYIGESQLDLMENCVSGVARIFNAYGEYNDYGETAQVVPSLIKKAIIFPRQPFVVWGDGHQTRCLLYIDDCIDALLKLEKLASHPPLKVNIGDDRETTIKELAELIIKISGKPIHPRFDLSAPVGPVSRVPDISRARKKLDWQPRFSLEQGLRRTYSFMLDQLNDTPNN